LRTSHGPLPIGLAVLGTVHEVGTLYVMYPTLNPDGETASVLATWLSWLWDVCALW
jgi:hypothetical protein